MGMGGAAVRALASASVARLLSHLWWAGKRAASATAAGAGAGAAAATLLLLSVVRVLLQI